MATTDVHRLDTNELVYQAKAAIEFEDDPHRAALEDNPEHARCERGYMGISLRMVL